MPPGQIWVEKSWEKARGGSVLFALGQGKKVHVLAAGENQKQGRVSFGDLNNTAKRGGRTGCPEITSVVPRKKKKRRKRSAREPSPPGSSMQTHRASATRTKVGPFSWKSQPPRKIVLRRPKGTFKVEGARHLLEAQGRVG